MKINHIIIYSIFVSNVVMAQDDITPPAMTYVSVDPTEIDVQNENDTLFISFGASDDLSGVSNAQLGFSSPSGNHSEYASFDFNGAMADTLTSFIIMEEYAESGDWYLHSVSINDEVNNNQYYSHSELDSLEIFISFTVYSRTDSIPPEMVYISLDQTEVDVTESEAAINVIFGASDNMSGVSNAQLGFSSPSGSHNEYISFDFNGADIDTLVNEMTIDQYSESGDWYLNSVSINDEVSNNQYYDQSDLDSLGFAISFYVNSIDDTIPPAITYIFVDPSEVDIADSSAIVNVAFGASDNMSGVSNAQLGFSSPSGSHNEYISFDFNGADIDTLVNEMTIDQYSESGDWYLNSVSINDEVNNNQYYDHSDLYSMGIEVIINVNNGSELDPCELGVVYVSEGFNSGVDEDYIEIYNSGDNDCSMEGFQLDNSEDLEDFTFGNIVIPAEGYWIGYENVDSSFSSNLSSEGDSIVFADPENNTFIVILEPMEEIDGIEISQSFDAEGVGCYTEPSPGYINNDCIILENDQYIILPDKVSLHQNYPNPFNPNTIISYDLPKSGIVNINIIDISGKIVKTLISGHQDAGSRSIHWNSITDKGEKVPSGLYFYTIIVEGRSYTRKMILLK